MEKKISDTVIRRLPIYHRYLTELIDGGIERISSGELSKLTGFTASQIRQDLNNFGGFGQQGYGYNAADLRSQIDKILGIDRDYKAVVVGVGHLGRAIARYPGFKKSGFSIDMLFDIDEVAGTLVGGIKVKSISELSKFLKENKIDVGIISAPKAVAQEIADILIRGNVKGIWNFAPVDIQAPESVVVENVRLNDSLLTLSYYLKENTKKNK
ncbi:redox-sensing transcriptional repressor [Peptoniphilus koenoeneniae]|uniref:Redox-sensing transcriptional repressor Rex n=1 Tax=Peptoniphilus koenoeneniae TaxID=507751 RepID=A0ABU0AW85_9FIRM|nr:redox-sensing transcriptional repressor Rex [Peptoniphilus koenoeneniae]MDQ0275091.1 redox-sensing transcriptional repressor [Peptoniphilus koenoeneniae]